MRYSHDGYNEEEIILYPYQEWFSPSRYLRGILGALEEHIKDFKQVVKEIQQVRNEIEVKTSSTIRNWLEPLRDKHEKLVKELEWSRKYLESIENARRHFTEEFLTKWLPTESKDQ